MSAGGIGALIEALATLPHLAVAKLGSNNIGPDGAIELAKHLSRLTGVISPSTSTYHATNYNHLFAEFRSI